MEESQIAWNIVLHETQESDVLALVGTRNPSFILSVSPR